MLGVDPLIEMEATLVATALISLLVAITVFPIVTWSQKRAAANPKIDHNVELLAGDRKLELHRLTGATGFYARSINLLANNLIGNVVVIAFTVVICGATIFALGSNFKGVEFFVNEEPDSTIVFVSARGNLSAKEASDIVGRL